MNESSDSAEELLKIYNEIDAHLRQLLKLDKYAEHGYLLSRAATVNQVVARHESELRAIAQLRNSIVHNPLLRTASPIAFPHQALVVRYRELRKAILEPQTALSIAIPGNKIYTAKLDTKLSQLLKDMNNNIFTHVPIIEEGVMIGVFSENTLLSYLADHSEAIFLKDMVVSEFKDYLPLSAHKGEKFKFLARSASVADVFIVFNKAIKIHERIGLLFITEHGKATERPLGIITAWDLATPDSETH